MTEIETLLTLTYDQCVARLLNKYGSVAKNYFSDPECTKKTSGIGRGKEGLYIHHVDEDKAIMLSVTDWARRNPYAYQKADRLVYCNLLEHLVLHIKIVEYPNPQKNPGEVPGVGGIYNFLVPELNDIYSGIIYKKEWKQKAVAVVLPMKEEYFKCIKKLVAINFNYPLLSSFNEYYGLWTDQQNKKIYQDLRQIGVMF